MRPRAPGLDVSLDVGLGAVPGLVLGVSLGVVPGLVHELDARARPRVELGVTLLTNKGGKRFRVGIFLDFAWLTTRTPHGGASYVRGAKRNRIDRHRGWN